MLARTLEHCWPHASLIYLGYAWVAVTVNQYAALLEKPVVDLMEGGRVRCIA